MNDSSFYQATRRHRADNASVAVTCRAYTFNYQHLLPASRQARIIDLGCSEGISLDWLVSHGYKNITGVDSDAVAIDIARKRLGGELDADCMVCMDALAYLRNCVADSADMIVMFNVIEHIPKPVILDMMQEIQRVLKAGGRFLAQTGNWENPFNIGLFARDFTHEVMYTQNSLRQLMLMSRFPEENIELRAVRYRTTLRNFPFHILMPVAGWLLKMTALSMRMHIHETAPLIYCVVTK